MTLEFKGCGALVPASADQYGIWINPARRCGEPCDAELGPNHGGVIGPGTLAMVKAKPARCRWCRERLSWRSADHVEVYPAGLMDFIGDALDSYINIGDESPQWCRFLAVNLATNALLWQANTSATAVAVTWRMNHDASRRSESKP